METVIQQMQQSNFISLCREQGIRYLGLFGSTARNESGQDSDVDLLVDFNTTKSLFELADLKISLENVLGKKVDLVMRKNIKKIIEPYINQDLITIYEQN